jgi:hypothetical protein
MPLLPPPGIRRVMAAIAKTIYRRLPRVQRIAFSACVADSSAPRGAKGSTAALAGGSVAGT